MTDSTSPAMCAHHFFGITCSVKETMDSAQELDKPLDSIIEQAQILKGRLLFSLYALCTHRISDRNSKWLLSRFHATCRFKERAYVLHPIRLPSTLTPSFEVTRLRKLNGVLKSKVRECSSKQTVRSRILERLEKKEASMPLFSREEEIEEAEAATRALVEKRGAQV